MNNWKKNTALFLSSQAISLFGSSVVSFAIVWFVTRETSSGLWVSLLTVSSYLPQFVVSFFAGVWADRYSRKKLIIAADTMTEADVKRINEEKNKGAYVMSSDASDLNHLLAKSQMLIEETAEGGDEDD